MSFFRHPGPSGVVRKQDDRDPDDPDRLVRTAAGQRLPPGLQRGEEIRGRPGRGKEPSLAFWRDEQGQGLVEYALIIVIIAIAVILAMIFLKDQLLNQFSNIGNNLT